MSEQRKGLKWACCSCAICRIVFLWFRHYTVYVCEPRSSVASSKIFSCYETTSISLDLHLSPFVQRISNFIAWNFWLRIHVLWLMISEAQHSPETLVRPDTLIYSPTCTVIEFPNNSTWKMESWTTRSIRSIASFFSSEDQPSEHLLCDISSCWKPQVNCKFFDALGNDNLATRCFLQIGFLHLSSHNSVIFFPVIHFSSATMFCVKISLPAAQPARHHFFKR